ncbi:MAG TPA: methyltransferase domain-containing protein [Gaiellaceae bacterium]|jgi:O-antigen chain-terminating methyltransferase|nr:methyltransferase domain-containing protein [Gaiellaceae bacterium]
MSGPEAKNPAPAGISSPEEIDVAALFERLREELRRGAVQGDSRGAEFASTRALAERFWPVTAERPAGGGPKGAVKRFLRKLMRWYVEPLAADQRVFNDSVLKLVDALSERADAASGAREQAERLVRELQERLERLERRAPAGSAGPPAPVTVAAQPAAAAIPDYFAFESRMRGSTDSIRERQRCYVDDLRAAAPVLDIGCGRGELLGLLREAGVEARGIDADADMAAYARGEGLDVEQADLVEYLGRTPDGSLGGIFMGQVVEHLPGPTLAQSLGLAAAKLRPGGVLIAETINPLSPIALRNYFADLTHAQPLVPETLELLARQAGFAETEIRFLNEPAERLTEPDDPVIAANVRRLNELLFAPLDYALVARTAANA